MIAKKQFDISDPLLCMEVIFGNGEIFRTGEAAGPLSIEENRKAGAVLTNPLGPGQTDIFRIIQGSKGSFGCASWISMQCDLIPQQRAFHVIDHDYLEPLFECGRCKTTNVQAPTSSTFLKNAIKAKKFANKVIQLDKNEKM